MNNTWLKICFSVLTFPILLGASVDEALTELRENSYGFVVFDVGITPEDLEHFSSVDIQREWVYHQFGELEMLEQSIVNFIGEIGSNGNELTVQIASRLKEIAQKVIEGSGKETGWACLRSFTPTNRFDIPRWHVDGHYYNPNRPEDILFKFVVTLVGPTTLFYQMPLELRKTTEKAVHNRLYMKNFCKQENIISPNLGEGAIFRAGQYTGLAALHSEPPIHENRLFFSVVPCTETQLSALKTRVTAMYPKNSSKHE
jgi:hypothetical protein